MSVATGLAVMQAMFDAEITAACGPKGRHDPDRAAVRHGAGRGSVVLGGRRVPVSRPRARTVEGGEVPLACYRLFAAEDQLTAVVMERMLAGLATRRHVKAGEPVGQALTEQATPTRRSAGSPPVLHPIPRGSFSRTPPPYDPHRRSEGGRAPP